MPGNTNVPEVPAPANSQTMKCSDFTKLDEATQRAVIKAILDEQGPPQGQGREESEMVAAIMASTMCSISAERGRQRGGARRVAAVSG